LHKAGTEDYSDPALLGRGSKEAAMVHEKTEPAGGPARQKQESQQSARQGEPKEQAGKPHEPDQNPAGIGASQGQDRASRSGSPKDRPSAGTPDIERAGGTNDVERSAAGESLVQDPTGAYKERP
jgi:hypothetical protein